jgi:hypothetical protein
MKTIQMELRIDEEGVLDMRVPVGIEEAGERVLVTIQPRLGARQWQELVEQTYGSCAGMGLERQAQGVA